MKTLIALGTSIALLVAVGLVSAKLAASDYAQPPVVQGTLVAPGSTPFHLKATIAAQGEPNKGEIEIYWMAPDKWRRTITTEEFSQTVVVNGDRISEQDSEDYFPLWLQTLANAMVDPEKILSAFRQGDHAYTKANGASSESGRTCFGPSVCGMGPFGLQETVETAGHSVTFMEYRDFDGKRIAHLLSHRIDPGYSVTAKIVELKELKHPDASLFQVPESKQGDGRLLQSIAVSEEDFRKNASESSEIIWPQVLDGATTGPASFYVSVDCTGRVREVLPIATANERSNESAISQIMKWKFKPFVKDGKPVQAESILSFTLNTRAYGPAGPLKDAEVRKLVTNAVEPTVAPGTVPAGTTKTLRIAVDFEGNVYEVIAADGPPALTSVCRKAMAQWHFSPYMENGQPRPYRAEVVFKF